MKLWLLEQRERTGYDTYDSCVVVADSEEMAKDMFPGETYNSKPFKLLSSGESNYDWAISVEFVTATYLGEAADSERRVVCASFNAG